MKSTDTAQISPALFQDRNVPFPNRPKLIPDLHTFAMPDGLGVQIRGSSRPVVLAGVTACEVLPDLLPLLDGTRTRQELYSDSPNHIRRQQIDELLLALFIKGLLQEGEPDHPADRSHKDLSEHDRRQLLFWGRNLGITFANSQAEDVLTSLTTAKLVFVGSGLFGLAAYHTLRSSGCTFLSAFDSGGDRLFSSSTKMVKSISGDEELLVQHVKDTLVGADLLITATRAASHSFFETINVHCLRERIKWVRGNDDLGTIEVGPFVDPGSTGCYMCFRIRHSSSIPLAIEDELFHQHLAKITTEQRTFAVGESLALATMAAGMLANEVVKILTSIAEPATENAVVSLSLDTPYRRDNFLKVPRCYHCFSGTVDAAVRSND